MVSVPFILNDLFCLPTCDGLLPSGSRTDSTLIATGFDNWKKVKDKFRAHKKAKDILFAQRALNKQPPCHGTVKFSRNKSITEIFDN